MSRTVLELQRLDAEGQVLNAVSPQASSISLQRCTRSSWASLYRCH